jgi:hypothetical protein
MAGSGGIWQDTVMARKPHLIDYQGAMRCSICKMPFLTDAQPSQDEAFADHVTKAHRPGQTREDANQAAARIVRETTKD